MSRHPFEYISKRYSLGALLLAMTVISLALGLATFDVGRLLLGILVTVVSILFTIACWSWVLGTFGERQKFEQSTTAAPTDDYQSRSAQLPQNSESVDNF